MKKKLLFLICGLSILTLTAQEAGIFQTYVIIDSNGSGNQYYAGGFNPDMGAVFNGLNLGLSNTLTLNGGEIKTFKNNGGDVTGAELLYRVYEQNATPPNFTTVNLPFGANLNTPGDQRWENISAGIDLLDGITVTGTYNLEIYWKITTNLNPSAVFDSNTGNNFIGTFEVDTNTLSVQNETLLDNTTLYTINNELYIKNLDTSIDSFEIYNILGKQVLKKDGLNSKAVSANLGNLSSGVYIAKIVSGSSTISKKFMF